jgi:site-specific recombinase XerD
VQSRILHAASYFAYVAKKWLRFIGRLKPVSARRARFADQLDGFAQYMAWEQGLSPQSIQSNSWKASKFLTWFGERHRSLASVNLNHVDEFLAMKAANGWNRRSVSTAAQSLRAFFRYAEQRSEGASYSLSVESGAMHSTLPGGAVYTNKKNRRAHI